MIGCYIQKQSLSDKILGSKALETSNHWLSEVLYRALSWKNQIPRSIEDTKAPHAIRKIHHKETAVMPFSKTVLRKALCSGGFVNLNLDYAIQQHNNGQTPTANYRTPLLDYLQKSQGMDFNTLAHWACISNVTTTHTFHELLELGYQQQCIPPYVESKHGNIEAIRVIADSLTLQQPLRPFRASGKETHSRLVFTDCKICTIDTQIFSVFIDG